MACAQIARVCDGRRRTLPRGGRCLPLRGSENALTCSLRQTSPLFGVAAVNSVVFGSYGIAMRLQLDHPADSPTLMQYGVAGSASGAVTALITTPIERLKVLQQCASTSGPQPRVVDLLKSMSLARLYRGFGATVLRDLGYGPYFMVRALRLARRLAHKESMRTDV